jgi:UDP-N-acetylmuramoyl-tripeptide--D-alanyl-D-alanine ligase
MDIIRFTVYLKCSSVSIDTRKIEKNSMFVAIKGNNFDANTFSKEALNNGLYAIIDNEATLLMKEPFLLATVLLHFRG